MGHRAAFCKSLLWCDATCGGTGDPDGKCARRSGRVCAD